MEWCLEIFNLIWHSKSISPCLLSEYIYWEWSVKNVSAQSDQEIKTNYVQVIKDYLLDPITDIQTNKYITIILYTGNGLAVYP